MESVSGKDAWLPLGLVWCLGCGPVVDVGGESKDTEAATSTNSGSSSSTAGVTSSPPPVPPPPLDTTSGSSSSTGTDPADDPCNCGVVCKDYCAPMGCPGYDPECGPSIECSIWDQDCPPDEKCNPRARNDSPQWNATRCFPLDPDPSRVGEPCVAQDGMSGVDDCGLAELCFATDAEGNGTCVSFCSGSENAPVCPEGLACALMNEGVLALCLPTCDPLAQGCGEGQGCFPVDATFVCLPVPTDGIMVPNCNQPAGCELGTVCLPAQIVPGCEVESGCCSPWCALSSPECPPELDCLPWFEDGNAPPEFADVGVCAVLP